MTRIGAVISVALVAIISVATASPEASESLYEPSIFRSQAARYDDTRDFKKWISMLERRLAQQSELDGKGCDFGPYTACGPYYWRKFVSEIRNDSAMHKIEKVQSYLNQFRYTTDSANWNLADFWETPLEFLEVRGDCEDYAIIKYFTLKKLGFNPDSMRVVVVNDLHLRTGHAVLLLEHDAKAYILDNQIIKVTEAKDVLHYRALYSINERHWWKHVYR